MQSDLLEGIEAAFTYLILNTQDEKLEFYLKMDDFEDRARNYIQFDLDHTEDVEKSDKLIEIIQTQRSLVDSAEVMFESFEDGDLGRKSILAFENHVDEIESLVDELIEMEIADIYEHVDEIEKSVLDSDISTESISHIENVQIPALIETNRIQLDLLEGIEEAFAYLILNDENEKLEFYLKMEDFEDHAKNYVNFALDNVEDVEENKVLIEIIKTQAGLCHHVLA